ncbi:hypothetical protein RDV84_24390 [Lysobacter yananisis]|uniref:Uncharacterized protein n=1 Tax=Lysobacter yananisis TaxID=1003114 RepID=A0ABY9PAK7_9GAMM|nr:hypothetical protein [Lysobacter yananisis]WMT03055.1 hypothetical protein RDV84_24390 [Lysobacter yananisis]
MAKKDSAKNDSAKAAKPAAIADKYARKHKRHKPDGKYPTHRIELTVAHVGFGGNAGKGHYFYSFAPDVVTFQGGPVWIEYAFEAQVQERFEIVNVLTSDAFKQIGEPEFEYDKEGEKNVRKVFLFNKNSVSTLIFFTVLVRDRQSNYNDVELISCDPQVGNDPQITPTKGKGK